MNKLRYPTLLTAITAALTLAAACSDGGECTSSGAGAGGTTSSCTISTDGTGAVGPGPVTIAVGPGPVTIAATTTGPPVCGSHFETPKPERAEFLIVLDRSNTMNEKSADQRSKWEHAMDALSTIGKDDASLKTGLSVFPDLSESPCLEQTESIPLSLGSTGKDLVTLATDLGDEGHLLHPGHLGNGITPTLAALTQAYHHVTAAQRPVDIVFIGDGKQPCGGGADRTDAMLQWMNEEVEIRTHVIGFGGKVNDDNLQRMACSGGMAVAGCEAKLHEQGPKKGQPILEDRKLPESVPYTPAEGKLGYPMKQYSCTGGETCFRLADHAEQLASDLKEIMAVPSCTLSVEVPTEALPKDDPTIVLHVGDDEDPPALEEDENFTFEFTQGDTDEEPGTGVIQLLGSTCEDYRSGELGPIAVEFTCVKIPH